MFRKRIKKEFPPGTFIPTKPRVLSILQLCIAFTVIMSAASYPFMGEIFEHRSQELIIHELRSQKQFVQLPKADQERLIEKHEILQAKMQTSFTERLGKSLHILFFDMPLFKQLWIVLTIAIPILILLKVDGARQAAWLLPIVTACFIFNNVFYGYVLRNPQEALYPSEQLIIEKYLKKPLSPEIAQQQIELTHGWELYLIQEWAHQTPSTNETQFKEQVAEGEFAFNMKRSEMAPKYNIKAIFRQKENTLLLSLYFLWNCFFAIAVKTQRRGDGEAKINFGVR